MTLSNRLWRAIAWRWRDSLEDAHVWVWAKVRQQAHGKRHAFTRIVLNRPELRAVTDIILQPPDRYLRFCVQHEREHNPEFAL